MDEDCDVEGDLEALDPPHTDPWSIQRPRRRRKSRIIVALAGLVTVAIFVSVVAGIRKSGRTASSVRFCLSLPLTGKLTYFPATSRRSLGHLRGEVGGFPPNDYVEANLLDSRRPAPVYLDNGLMGPEVVDRVGFQTKGNGSQRIAEVVAVDPTVTVDQIAFRVWTRRADDLRRPFGSPARRC